MILVTLNEKLPCDTDCYTPVFYIQNQLTFESKYFTAADISTWPSRYNLFELTVVGLTASENLMTGQLYFTQSHIGQWTYTVYNQPCVVPGIDPDEFVNVLETGYFKLSN